MKRGEKRTSKSHSARSSKSSGSIRIISGRFRGRKLPVLDVQGLRPTTDKNKEMLFNWLMPYVHNARCLDAFAGSGGLGFEALSRQAQSTLFVELDKKVVNKLTQNIQLLSISCEQATVLQGAAASLLAKQQQVFDLIFLDPPFNKNLLPEVINTISQQNLLAPGGVIYIECAGSESYQVPDSWQLIKEKLSAQVSAKLYKRISE
ncbi:16S rRNA (guanine(966)-N(2))-methyltransferase RsmD [uncultured Paraglaciecola sp.]|uniref:16S rRNA (guanine(966)-N(2))-methyltransferase RsmD n=1 Tax=uncultured Paraglaciecola sp. TaxID=1765024 RepID=UPI0026122ED5|nr:16S rRNA (guanine(966)-N(2))-methyltransferase RsmD [uncultured Paraglaciecola sp.]